MLLEEGKIHVLRINVSPIYRANPDGSWYNMVSRIRTQIKSYNDMWHNTSVKYCNGCLLQLLFCLFVVGFFLLEMLWGFFVVFGGFFWFVLFAVCVFIFVVVIWGGGDCCFCFVLFFVYCFVLF